MGILMFSIFLLKKHLILGKKIVYGFGGYIPPPFTDKIFSEKGVTDLGDTDKIRKVVFDGFPYMSPRNSFFLVQNKCPTIWIRINFQCCKKYVIVSAFGPSVHCD